MFKARFTFPILTDHRSEVKPWIIIPRRLETLYPLNGVKNLHKIKTTKEKYNNVYSKYVVKELRPNRPIVLENKKCWRNERVVKNSDRND